MVYPQQPPQPPAVGATKTGADIKANAELDAHDRQDELAARVRERGRETEPGLLDRIRRFLKR
jgi:hypothetical protein